MCQAFLCRLATQLARPHPLRPPSTLQALRPLFAYQHEPAPLGLFGILRPLAHSACGAATFTSLGRCPPVVTCFPLSRSARVVVLSSAGHSMAPKGGVDYSVLHRPAQGDAQAPRNLDKTVDHTG